MAGSYPDPPSWRIPYDLDGSIILTNGVQSPNSTVASLNDDSLSNTYSVGYNSTVSFALIFPRKLDIVAMWYYCDEVGSFGSTPQPTWSPDTTNGTDGTWNSFPVGIDLLNGEWRNPQAVTVTGVRSIRGSVTGGSAGGWISGLHLYGTYAAGEDIDRLEFWHPTLDQRAPAINFDLGDVPRGTTTDKQFRIKNLSDTLTANGIVLSADSLTDTTPSFEAMHTFSTTGTYTGTLNIGTLSPGQISSIVTVRQVVPIGAQLSKWTTRLRAEPTSWT